MKTPLWGQIGLKIRAGDGTGEPGFPEMLGTPLFYKASPGDTLTLLDTGYTFNVATYRPEVEPRWMYTYDYAPEQNWTVYRGDLTGDSYRQTNYIFNENVYFRVCLRKMDGSLFDQTDDINTILAFDTAPAARPIKPWLEDEIQRVSYYTHKIKHPNEFTLAILTDSHYTVNGTWDDTLTGITLLSREIGLDGIIHLGDLTDGMVPGDVTRHYAKTMLAGLKNCGVPVWFVIGNHDSNYFKNNPDRFTEEEQRGLYLDGREIRYSVDLPGLRLMVIDSYDPAETLRYGYSPPCISWLEQAFATLPADSAALILSHLPPVTRLQYWTKALRGEEEILGIAKRNKDKLIAWVNGHNHADRLDNKDGFPIVSIANAKCEAFTERKTEGFVTPERRLGDASQELWDIALVNPTEKSMRFVRFGAGSNRGVFNGKAWWM